MSDSTNQGSIRMLALVTEALNGYGGIAQYNCDFLMAAARLPGVAALDVHPRISEPNICLQQGRLRQRRAVYNRFLYSLRALLVALVTRPQVIFCGHLYHVRLARWVARISGAKLISQLHGSEIWGDLPADLVAALAASDVVFCVSDHTKSVLMAQSNLSDKKIVVLPNRMRDLFGLQDRLAARQSLKLGELPIVLSVGRLDSRQGYKGHDRIISVMNKLQRKGLSFDYVIVGEGEDRPRLEALVEAEALTDRVHFFGRVDENRLPSIYAAADLFALPSTGEGFGIVFIEASACGTPVIGLDVGGTSEAMCDEKWCRAVAPEDFELRFEEALLQSLQITDAERAELSVVTHRQFGAEAFNQRVRSAMMLVS